MEAFVDIGLWAATIMLVIAILAAIIMPIINSLNDPKSLMVSGAGILILAVIFLVSYAIAGDEVTANYITYNVTTPGMSKMIGGGLTMMFILFIITVVGVVFTEIYKALN
ncbi:MAG: hypothetical protein OEY51_07625 [Cyclobacteriaceae bacterium]|nr:hypothetical protein [Cyclobacteriaceae bacterium]